MRPSVLVVSKPVVPPWNDSSKNLARDLVLGTQEVDFTVLTDGRSTLSRPNVTERPIYRSAGGFAPALRQNLAVLGTLMGRHREFVHHFFFAPNRRTSRIIRAIRSVRRRPAVHTVCSVPERFEGIDRLLFADVTVAVSRHTAERLAAHSDRDIRVIPPGIPPLEPIVDPSARRALRLELGLPEGGLLVVFPGDYEFSNAASVVAEAAVRLGRTPELSWVFACRVKTPASRGIEADIKGRLADLAEGGRVRFFNHVPRIHDLLSAADLVVLPADSTYAKMDLPLVLLEALALGRPIVVTDRPPLSELPVPEAGYAIPPGEPDALVDVVRHALDHPGELEVRGHRGVALAREGYDRSVMAGRYAAIYTEIMEVGAGGAE